MQNTPHLVITSGRLSVSTALLLREQGTAVEFEPESGNVYLIKDTVEESYEQTQAKTA